MPTTFTCRLKIAGRLVGPPIVNQEEIVRFRNLMGERPTPGSSLADPWPLGFVPTACTVDHWCADYYAGGEQRDQTVLSFLAVLSYVVDGTLYDNRQAFGDLFHRFSSYRDTAWHKDLRAKLNSLNQALSAQHRQIDRIWFREIHVWADDSGDM